MRRSRLLALIILGAIVGGGWMALQALDGVKPAPKAQTGEIAAREVIVALGRVEPASEEIRVAAATTGRIAAVVVDEGQQIAAGDVLAVLDDADRRARLQEAEARHAVSKAALDRVVNGARPEERAEAAAAVIEAEAVLEQAARELTRHQDLSTQRAGSRQDLDRARSEHAIAVARLEQARQRRNAIDSPPRADDLAKVQAEAAQAEAQVAVARAEKDKATVRSPIDGVVLRRLRHPGELVTDMADTPIVAIGDLSRRRVRAEIDEAEIARLRVGQQAYVKAQAYGDRRFPGVVNRVGNVVGRKGVRSDRPAERLDARVLETLIDLEPGTDLPVGLRVDVYILSAGH